MRERWSSVDGTGVPPVVSFPSRYNAAVDLVERHVAEGRGSRAAFLDDAGSVTFAELADRTARVAARAVSQVPPAFGR